MADPTSADRSRLQPVPLVPFADRDRFGAALPVSLTSFVGREREVAEVCAILHGDARLVTLIGPGGVGKTRLALAAAAAVADGFPDGTVFVGLAALADPALVLPTVAQALGVREAGDRPLVERLHVLLGGRRLLLVLDNLEHLVDAAPRLAALLAACPCLTVLATSRTVLRVSGEQVIPVPPLSLPSRGVEESRSRGVESVLLDSSPARLLDSSEAVALFAQRARAADPAFALTAENAATVAEIVRRLDGLPLAIELAAARMRSLSPFDLLVRLTGSPLGEAPDRLRLLTGGARDLPTRQRTMRDAIGWSHDLLDAAEKILVRRLAVFAGGFTLEAAEHIGTEGGRDGRTECEPIPFVPPSLPPSVLDLVGSLVDQSLLQRVVGPEGGAGGGESRYLMLETVREYARDRLEASGEVEPVRARHADYFAGRAEAIAPYLQWRSDTARSIARLDADLDNMRSALAWAAEGGAQTSFLRLAVALQSYWALRGRLAEGQAWLDRAMSVSETAPLPLRAAVVRAAGWIARGQGDFARAEPLGERGLALSRQHGDTVAVVHALSLLGYIAEEQGRFARSRAFHEEALALGRRLADPAWAAWSMRNIGQQVLLLGERETAERCLEEALALFQRGGHHYGAAVTQRNLASIALWRGAHARAAMLLRGQLDLAWDTQGLRHCLEALTEVAVACGEMERAARLLGAAEAHRERLGVALVPRQVSGYERNVADARNALGEALFAAIWDEGRRLSPDEARAEAFRVVDDIAGATEPGTTLGEGVHGLTPRELDVLRLVADGRTDREIAEALFIGAGTVRAHLTNIFAKLEVGSRTAAVAAARRRGIV